MIGKIIKYGLSGIVLLVVLFIGWLWIAINVPQYSWRQKMTLAVKTPNGTVLAAAIQQIDTFKDHGKTNPGVLPGSRQVIEGEAVVLEVAEGQYLFALLKPASERVGMKGFGDILTRIVAPDNGARTHPALKVSASQPVGASFIVPEKYYPLLVTFEDINDPKTVKQVDPNDLMATFGPGYSLKSIALEITDEPVTEGRVESALRWINNQKFRLKPTDKKYVKDLLPEEDLYKQNFLRKKK